MVLYFTAVSLEISLFSYRQLQVFKHRWQTKLLRPNFMISSSFQFVIGVKLQSSVTERKLFFLNHINQTQSFVLSEVFFNQSWCLSVKKNCLRDPVLCDEKAYFSYITLYFKEWWRLCSFLLFNGRFVRAWVRAQKLVSHTWKCESGRPLLATNIFGSWRRQPWWAVTVPIALCQLRQQ